MINRILGILLLVLVGFSISSCESQEKKEARKLEQVEEESRVRERAAAEERAKIEEERREKEEQEEEKRKQEEELQRREEEQRQRKIHKVQEMAEVIGQAVVKCYHPTAKFESVEIPVDIETIDPTQDSMSIPMKVNFVGVLSGDPYYMRVDVNFRTVDEKMEIQVPPAGVDTAPFPAASNCMLRSWTPM